MTLPLRRKRRTTVRGRNTPARMAASLLGLGLLLAAGSARAQGPALPPAQAAPQAGDQRFTWPSTQPAQVREPSAPRSPAPAPAPFPAAQARQPMLVAAQKMQERPRASDEI